MKNHTITLPLDLTKRHFVIGDIHGHLDMLEDLLASADYDPKLDVLYSVGDLIDRGPYSVEVVEFFQQDNCHAIRGNHELMVVDAMQWHGVWMGNGGVQTMNSLRDNDHDLVWLQEQFRPLPYVIDVGDADEEFSFRLVHADLPLVWSEEDFQYILENAEDEDDTRLAHILWSRTTIESALRNIKNLKPKFTGMTINPDRSGRNVFAGHTPIERPLTVGDITFIDTWRARTLTMVEAITNQEWSVKVRPQS